MLAGSWYALLNYCSDREEIATEWQMCAIGTMQIWECCRTTVSVFPDKQEKIICRKLLQAEAERWALRTFPQGFWAPQNPKHVWGCVQSSARVWCACQANSFCLGCVWWINRAARRRGIWEPYHNTPVLQEASNKQRCGWSSERLFREKN